MEIGKEDKKHRECTACGKILQTAVIQPPSAGLEYELSSDGTYYTITGIGTCKDRDVIIPSEYKNLPVKEHRRSRVLFVRWYPLHDNTRQHHGNRKICFL